MRDRVSSISQAFPRSKARRAASIVNPRKSSRFFNISTLLTYLTERKGEGSPSSNRCSYSGGSGISSIHFSSSLNKIMIESSTQFFQLPKCTFPIFSSEWLPIKIHYGRNHAGQIPCKAQVPQVFLAFVLACRHSVGNPERCGKTDDRMLARLSKTNPVADAAASFKSACESLPTIDDV